MDPLIPEGIKGLVKAGYPLLLPMLQGVDGKILWQEAPAHLIPPVVPSSPPPAPQPLGASHRVPMLPSAQDISGTWLRTTARGSSTWCVSCGHQHLPAVSNPHWPRALVYRPPLSPSIPPISQHPPDYGPGQALVFLLLPHPSLTVG